MANSRTRKSFFSLYLDALDDELLILPPSIGGNMSATALPGVEEREVSQTGLTDVRRPGFMVRRLLQISPR